MIVGNLLGNYMLGKLYPRRQNTAKIIIRPTIRQKEFYNWVLLVILYINFFHVRVIFLDRGNQKIKWENRSDKINCQCRSDEFQCHYYDSVNCKLNSHGEF